MTQAVSAQVGLYQAVSVLMSAMRAGEPTADCSTPAAPGSADQQRRSLPNPFESRSGGKKQPHTLKWAVFEVLRDYPAGLGLADIVRLVEDRKLRSFAKTNPAGQASHQATCFADCILVEDALPTLLPLYTFAN